MARSGLRVVLWAVFWLALVFVAGFGLAITIQGSRFERRVHAEAHALLERIAPVRAAAAPALSVTPPPVARYLELAGATRRTPVRNVRLRHGGTFQPSVDARPFAIRGEQYLVADPPGYVWWGRIRVAPGIWIDGRDRSVDGAGNMLIQAVSTFTLADARGTQLDEGALQRLLGELAWLPTALRDGRYVRWEPIDVTSARAFLRVGEREVQVVFHFGSDGWLARVTADRWRDVDGRAILTPWEGEIGDWRVVDGLRVPFRIAATWTLDGKPFTYARWEVQQIEYDVAEPY
ncbi:MAG TPA: DUF6544 family protein [Anaeromyxobacteraceae bacterium]|nr:DUF6544 family protein [Anaeromyxobacteraceae bacterium]